MKISLPVIYSLAFISGAVGLAYEIVFIRLLSIYFGDVYYITAIVLVSVFTGLAVGYWWGHLWTKYIWMIELLLAFVVCAYATVHLTVGSVTLLPVLVGIPNAVSLTICALIAGIPMVLIGASIPMIDRYGSQFGSQFDYIYQWYNIGAALWILFLEFFVLQHFSLGKSIIALGLVNICVGFFLLRIIKKIPVTSVDTQSQRERLDIKNSYCLGVLFVVSVMSSMWYLYAVELSMRIFGSTTSTISMVIALSVASIGLACILTRTLSVRYFYPILGLIVGLVYANMTWILNLYSQVLQSYSVAERSLEHLGIQLIMMTILLVPIFVLFGSTIPVWAREYKISSRLLLASVSVGNAIGICVGYFVFYKYIAHSLPVIIVLLLVTLLVCAFSKLKTLGTVITCVFLGILVSMIINKWPQTKLEEGYKHYFNSYELGEITAIDTYRTKGNDATVINRGPDHREVVHLGYQTLTFYTGGNINQREGAAGLLGALYQLDDANKAMFVGLGTGASVGAASHVYKDLTVYEINPAMLSLAKDFNQDFGLFDDGSTKENVEIVINDGIIGIAKQQPNSLSAVINVATLPTFFSANKVHALEFFQLAKKVLQDDGVYVGWIDMNAGVEGLTVYNKTLLSVFKQCDYYLLNTGYIGYVCGDSLTKAQIIPDSYSDNTEVQLILERMIHAQIPIKISDGEHVNSVDFPALIMFGVMGKGGDDNNVFEQSVLSTVIEKYISINKIEKRELCKTMEWLQLYEVITECNLMRPQ